MQRKGYTRHNGGFFYGNMALDLSNANAAAQTAENTGNNAINSFDPRASASTAMGQSNNLYTNQTGGQKDLFNQFSGIIASQPQLSDTYKNLNQQYNVQPLLNTANYLNQQVTNAIPNQVQAGRGFDIGAAQEQNAVAQKLAYLQPQAQAATQNAQTAENLVNQGVGYQQTQNQYQLQPIQQFSQGILQAQGIQGQGWNQAMASELQGYIDKMNAGVKLSQAEEQRASALAQAEEGYQAAQVQAQAQVQAAQLGNQYRTVPAGQSLINTFSGGVYRAK